MRKNKKKINERGYDGGRMKRGMKEDWKKEE